MLQKVTIKLPLITILIHMACQTQEHLHNFSQEDLLQSRQCNIIIQVERKLSRMVESLEFPL